jgi:hypothetical protein
MEKNMNGPENKRMLWELTNHLYKAWMSREQVISTFEKTIEEVDAESAAPLMEKNKRFLSVYVERVNAIQPADATQRATMFEERLKTRLVEGARPVEKKSVSFVNEIDVIEIVEEDLKKTMKDLREEVKELRAEVQLLKHLVTNAHDRT